MPSLLPNDVRPRVLIIDSDAARAARAALVLRTSLSCEPVVVREWAPGVPPDLVVLAAPEEGAGSRSALLRRFGDTPVLVVTERHDDRNATAWILAGADDVVGGEDPVAAALASAAVRVLARARRRAAAPAPVVPGSFAKLSQVRGKKGRINSLVAFLQAAALTDPLTGLANRRALDARLERAWSESLRDGHDLAILMIDVDNFKQTNDRFGHSRGDALLVALAEAVRSQCRKGDLAARFGGDEVIVLLPHADAAQAHAVAERLHDDFAARTATFPDEGPAHTEEGARSGLSIGVASRFSSAAMTAQELMGRADEALYAAKRDGKGCTRICAVPPAASQLTAV